MDFRFLCPDNWLISSGLMFSWRNAVIIVRRESGVVCVFTSEACGVCHGLHELTQGMDTEWLSCIPHLSFRTLNHGQVEWESVFIVSGGLRARKVLKIFTGHRSASSRCVGWNTSLRQILSYRFSSWILAPFSIWCILSFRRLLLVVSQGLRGELYDARHAHASRNASCCWTKLYGEELQANGLQVVSRSKTFQAHRLLDPAPCLDDLLYLTTLVAFVLTPTPREKFQRSYLEWCCNSFRVVADSGRNFVETKLKFPARTLLR